MYRDNQVVEERLMDSMDLEREREQLSLKMDLVSIKIT